MFHSHDKTTMHPCTTPTTKQTTSLLSTTNSLQMTWQCSYMKALRTMTIFLLYRTFMCRTYLQFRSCAVEIQLRLDMMSFCMMFVGLSFHEYQCFIKNGTPVLSFIAGSNGDKFKQHFWHLQLKKTVIQNIYADSYLLSTTSYNRKSQALTFFPLTMPGTSASMMKPLRALCGGVLELSAVRASTKYQFATPPFVIHIFCPFNM